jgi:hypothetical protein
MPASPRKVPVSVRTPIAELPSLRVMNAFSISEAVSRNSCITVSINVSLTIFLLMNIFSPIVLDIRFYVERTQIMSGSKNFRTRKRGRAAY